MGVAAESGGVRSLGLGEELQFLETVKLQITPLCSSRNKHKKHLIKNRERNDIIREYHYQHRPREIAATNNNILYIIIAI